MTRPRTASSRTPIAAPKCELRLVDGAKSLALVSLETSSKKIAKHTVLATWYEHAQISTRPEGGIVWLAQPKDLIFCKETESVMTLGKAFKDLELSPGVKPARIDLSNEAFDDTRENILLALSCRTHCCRRPLVVDGEGRCR